MREINFMMLCKKTKTKHQTEGEAKLYLQYLQAWTPVSCSRFIATGRGVTIRLIHSQVNYKTYGQVFALSRAWSADNELSIPSFLFTWSIFSFHHANSPPTAQLIMMSLINKNEELC